jgi:acetyl-CoA acetyltransferase
MKNPCIVGWAHTRFGRLDGETLESLITQVTTGALADAGISGREVDAIFVGNLGGFENQACRCRPMPACASSRRRATRTPAPAARRRSTRRSTALPPAARASRW